LRPPYLACMALNPLEICTQDDVIARLGGEKVANQLLDPQGTANRDTSLIQRAIRDASAMVAMSCGNNFKIWLAGPDWPQSVVLLTALIAVYLCWQYGSQGQAVPADVVTSFTYAQSQLQKIESGQILLGEEPNPQARRVRRPIDNSDCGRRWVYSVSRVYGPTGRR